MAPEQRARTGNRHTASVEFVAGTPVVLDDRIDHEAPGHVDADAVRAAVAGIHAVPVDQRIRHDAAGHVDAGSVVEVVAPVLVERDPHRVRRARGHVEAGTGEFVREARQREVADQRRGGHVDAADEGVGGGLDNGLVPARARDGHGLGDRQGLREGVRALEQLDLVALGGCVHQRREIGDKGRVSVRDKRRVDGDGIAWHCEGEGVAGEAVGVGGAVVGGSPLRLLAGIRRRGERHGGADLHPVGARRVHAAARAHGDDEPRLDLAGVETDVRMRRFGSLERIGGGAVEDGVRDGVVEAGDAVLHARDVVGGKRRAVGVNAAGIELLRQARVDRAVVVHVEEVERLAGGGDLVCRRRIEGTVDERPVCDHVEGVDDRGARCEGGRRLRTDPVDAELAAGQQHIGGIGASPGGRWEGAEDAALGGIDHRGRELHDHARGGRIRKDPRVDIGRGIGRLNVFDKRIRQGGENRRHGERETR